MTCSFGFSGSLSADPINNNVHPLNIIEIQKYFLNTNVFKDLGLDIFISIVNNIHMGCKNALYDNTYMFVLHLYHLVNVDHTKVGTQGS